MVEEVLMILTHARDQDMTTQILERMAFLVGLKVTEEGLNFRELAETPFMI